MKNLSDKPSQIYLVHENGQDKIWGRSSCELSHLTKEAAHNIFGSDINIIFTQNHFNITPLVSALFTKIEKSDVLVGLPGPISTNFKHLYKKYKEQYFSLVDHRNIFFYEEGLWCNGRIDEEENIKKLKIEKKPHHGKRSFKNRYEKYVERNLKNDNFQDKPKIILIPITGYLPFQNFENVNLKYKNEDYKLNEFRPKLIILESINERQFSFDSLKNLVDQISATGKKLVLHFSWPYLPKITSFLDYIHKNHPDSSVLHMGKVFCKEINKEIKEEKPKEFVSPLSLEGELWEATYHCDERVLKNKIRYILPDYRYEDISSAKNYDFIIDKDIINLKNSIDRNDYDINNAEINLLKYPPILNTFLPPNKMTRFVFDQETPSYLPLKESLERKIDDEELLSYFRGVESDLKPFDLGKHLMGLKTPRKIRKKTLLQTYLLNSLLDINKKTGTTTFYLANLHPSLGSRDKMKNELESFFSCVNDGLDGLWNYIFSKDKKLVELKDKISNYDVFEFLRNIDGNGSKLQIKLSSPVNFKSGRYAVNGLNIEEVRPTIAELSIDKEKIKNYKIIKSINIDVKTSYLRLEVEKEVKNYRSGKETSKSKYRIEYKDLSNFRYLPDKNVKSSILLLPGPIPYHTIKEEKILISQGYDSILLPFKEIIFFAYPGYNFLRVINQLKSFNELLTNEESELYNKDLAYSIENTNLNTKEKVFSKIEYDEEVKEKGSDTHLDNIVRKDILEKDEIEEEEKEKLGKLFDKITSIEETKRGISEYPTTPRDYSNQITLKVEFSDGTKERVNFPEDTLIRKFESGKYELYPIEEITPSDEILYVANRKSLDNELLEQFFSHVNYDLENILAPLTNLRTFYEELKEINFEGKFKWGTYSIIGLDGSEEEVERKTFQRLNWLSKSEKENLYYLLKSGFNDDYNEFEKYFSNDENIWKENLSTEQLWKIISKKNKISKGLLATIAKKLGLTLAETTFTQYISLIKDQKHYYFEDPINIKSIGKLIGNKKIIRNYQTINKHGKEISKVLIRIGRSISRVTSGNKRMGNEMDLYVSKYLKKCTVREVEK